LNVSPSLEESLVDCLLDFEHTQGFSSLPVFAHDHRNQGFSLAEQVSGRQKKIRFQLYVNKSNIAELLLRLKSDFSGSGIHYWVAPIIEQGEI
jgi:hypothetical protein